MQQGKVVPLCDNYVKDTIISATEKQTRYTETEVE